MTKYLVSEGWSHLFGGSSDQAVNWVLMCSSEDQSARVLAAEIDWHGRGFVQATPGELADLEDHLLNANDVENNIGTFDLLETDELPEWAAAFFSEAAAPAVR